MAISANLWSQSRPTYRPSDTLINSPSRTVLFDESALRVCQALCSCGRHLRLADLVSRAPDGLLRCDLAILQGKELRRRLQCRSCCEHGIKEVQHLRAQDRIVAADENQHLTWCDNLLGIAMTLL